MQRNNRTGIHYRNKRVMINRTPNRAWQGPAAGTREPVLTRIIH